MNFDFDIIFDGSVNDLRLDVSFDRVTFDSTANISSLIVSNSDDSYLQTITDDLELPDTTYDIYVNGIFNQSVTLPTLKDETINIS